MAIDPEDVARLEQRHRDAMLDLVLAWGTLDAALGVLLSRVRGIPLHQGAEEIGKLPGSAKLAGVVRALRRAPGGEDTARIMTRHHESYKRHSWVRHRIAHSHCAGVWTGDRDIIVFITFAKVGDDQLALDRVSILEVRGAARWGRAMRGLAMKLADALSGDEGGSRDASIAYLS